MRTIRLALPILGIILLGMAMSICTTAQTSSQPQPVPTPAPAFGQNAPVLNPDNPPVTGLDVPFLDLRTASRSFVAPALQVSESADTNGGNALGASGLESVTRVLGALDMQQFWPKSDLFLEYLGGGAFYGNPYQAKQLQAAGLEGVTRWRTGQATVRDSFSYVPDGSFQIGTFGGVPGLGLATGSGGLGNNVPGIHSSDNGGPGVGNIPRLSNTAILDVVQAINPVSAVTVAGGFSNTHFYDSSVCTIPPCVTLLNSDQITAQAGYSRLLSRRDQIGVVYAFQLFQFPQSTGGEIYNDVINLRWSHTITGRMSLIVGAGPQYTDLQTSNPSTHWSLSGRVQLHYKFAHSSMIATWEKFTSSGSGIFAGASTQAARLGYKRPLARTVDLYVDLGYSHNKKLQDLANLGFGAGSFDEGYASAIVRKHFGRSYDFFAAYRFSELGFDVPIPPGEPGFGSGKTAARHVGTIGVEWHPSPKRID